MLQCVSITGYIKSMNESFQVTLLKNNIQFKALKT